MNKKILYVLVLAFSNIFYGQKKITPSEIHTLIKIDTLQSADILLIIENEGNDKVWMSYNDKLIELLQKIDFNKIDQKTKKSFVASLSSCYGNRGYFYTNVNPDFNKAMFYYEKSLKLSTSISDTKNKINILKNIGSCQHNNGNLEKSLETFQLAYELAVSEKDLINQANVLSQIANYYTIKGADTKALEIFTKALKILDKTKDEDAKANTRRLMISIYIKQQEFEIALELLKQNYRFYSSKPAELQKLVENQYNISNVYLKLKNKKLYNYFSDNGMKLAFKTENFGALSNFYRSKRGYYLKEKQIDSAKKYTELNLKLISKLKTEPELSLAILDASDIYKLNKQYEKAKNLGILSFNNLEKIGFNSDLQKSSRNLKEIYQQTNQYQKAFFYAELELKIIDSLSKINIENSAIKSLFAYETEKKESQIIELSQKKKISELESKRKTSFLFIFGILFFAIATTAYVLFSKFKTKKQNEILQNQLAETQKLLEAEKKVTDSELKALKSQMNPHFIFNALNSIQSQFMFGDKLVANEQLNNFTYLTRQILEVSGKKNIAIADEVDILTKYLELEQMRFKKDLTYTISVSENIDEDYHKIPPMLLQPIVENSIKHGLLHQIGDKNVSINFDIATDESHLICTITDNGIGRQKSADIKSKSNLNHNSFSTNAIEERLELLNNNLKLNDLIIYEDVLNNENEVCGTKVILKIPLV